MHTRPRETTLASAKRVPNTQPTPRPQSAQDALQNAQLSIITTQSFIRTIPKMCSWALEMGIGSPGFVHQGLQRKPDMGKLMRIWL